MTDSPVRRPGSCFLWGFILILAVFAADQYSKWFVMETMLKTQQVVPTFQDWFLTFHKSSATDMIANGYKTIMLYPHLNIIMVWNKGISFGLLQNGSRIMTMAFIGISLFLSMAMIIWLAISRNALVSFALALVTGGAVGNLVDCVRFGAVADFIDFYVGDWHWPAFNVADSAIVLGAFVLILHTLFAKEA